MNSETYPNKLDDGTELQLLPVECHRFDRCFDPGPTQPSHQLQEMAPIWRLDVEWYKPPSRQRDDTWDPAFERRLNSRDLGRVKAEGYKGKGSRSSTIAPMFLRSIERLTDTVQ